MHNYWLSCLHRESQTLTPIFLLKHNRLLVPPTYSISMSQNYCKESSFNIQWSSWKFLLYPSWISITLVPNSYVMQITIAIINSQKDLSEAQEHKYFFKFYHINSQNNISEAWECISLKLRHHRALKDISEALEQKLSS